MAKYTYNSGQMIQAGVLLFQVTGKEEYLQSAQATAQSLFNHFTVPFVGKDGNEHRNFRNNPWFNVIAFRGFKALYEIDNNPIYVDAMIDVAEYAWKYTQDENGFLSGDWSGNRPKRYKWLLDNACMIELFTEAATIIH
ncbi:MAG: glycoside hydrolase family 76 protein [Thermoguttaceae bacterium]